VFVQPFLQWKSKKYYVYRVYVCSFSYPACNALAPYFHLWPVRFYHIIPHYLMNDTIFKKKKVNGYELCVLIFSIFAWNISYSKKNWARYCYKCTYVLLWSTRYFRPILIKLQFLGQIFEKISIWNFHENPFIGNRTDRRKTWWS
jgi:hypothetical protein